MLQEQASLWKTYGFSDDLLLRGEALSEAEAWAVDNVSDLTDSERDLLEESQYSRLCTRRLEAQARLVRCLALVATFIAFVAIQFIYRDRIERESLQLAKAEAEAQLNRARAAQEATSAMVVAEVMKREIAERAHREVEERWLLANHMPRGADARALAAYAHGAIGRDAGLAILLALEGARRAHPEGAYRLVAEVESVGALYRSLGHPGWSELLWTNMVEAQYRPAWRSSDWRIVGTNPKGGTAVWDGITGSRLVVLEGHTDEVTHSAWDSEGARIVTSSRDGTAIIWDARTGARLGILFGHVGEVRRSAWSSDETRIVTLGAGGTAVVWDATTSARLFTPGTRESITSATWSPDDAQITIVDTDGVSITWDAESGAKICYDSATVLIVKRTKREMVASACDS